MTTKQQADLEYLAGMLIRYAFEQNLIAPWVEVAEALRAIADILERG